MFLLLAKYVQNNKDTDVVMDSLLLTLNRFHLFFWCFHCAPWTGKCRPGLASFPRKVFAKCVAKITASGSQIGFLLVKTSQMTGTVVLNGFAAPLNRKLVWLYVLVMSSTRFRVNPHSVVAWMSRKSLLEAGAKSEV